MAVTDAEAIGRRDRGTDPGLPAPIPHQHLGPLGKAVGFHRSGARHISATDLTQSLLADLIVRVENTGFSRTSPGPL